MSIFSTILKPKSQTPIASGSSAQQDAVAANAVAKKENSFLGILKNTVKGIPEVIPSTAKKIFTKKPAQQFVVGENITPEQTTTARETIAKTDQYVKPKPLTQRNALDIFSITVQQGVEKKQGKPVTGPEISPELRKEAMRGLSDSVIGAVGGEDFVARTLKGKVPQSVFNFYAKETNPAKIRSSLRTYKVPEEVATPLSEKLAAARTAEEAKAIILSEGKASSTGRTNTFRDILKPAESNIEPVVRTPEVPSTVIPKQLESNAALKPKAPTTTEGVKKSPTKAENERAMMKVLIDDAMEKVETHPGKSLQRFISKKEGQFIDFANPETAKTPAERQRRIERINKISRVSENTVGGRNFDNPDEIRAQIEDYQKSKDNLSTLQEQYKAIKDEPVFTPPSADEIVQLAQKYKGHPEDFRTAVLSGDDSVLPFYEKNIRPTPKIDEKIVDAILEKGGYKNLDDVFYKANLRIGRARNMQDTRSLPQRTETSIPSPQEKIGPKKTAVVSQAQADGGVRQIGSSSYKNGTTPQSKAQEKSVTEPITTPEEAKESFETFERGDRAIDNEVKTPITKGELEQITQNAKDDVYKTVTGFMGKFRDVYRNFEKFFGKDYQRVKELVLDPFDAAKGEYVAMQKSLGDELYDEIVTKFGIKKGSKESAAVMDYGERNLEGDFAAPYTNKNGPRDRHKLVAEFGEKKADDIIAADAWFRQKYDALVDGINVERKKIYEGVWTKKKNLDEDIALLEGKVKAKQTEIAGKKRTDTLAYQKLRQQLESLKRSYQARRELLESDLWWRGKIIPKRGDYYRHFQELAEGFKALKNIIANDANIPTGLAGISPNTKPKSKFLAFAQARLGNSSVRDAVGGFLDYIPSASYATHIDPHIERFRKVTDALVDSENKRYSPFITYLTNFANDLSGKTNGLDREIQEITGRKFMQALNWVNTRVKANTILGNVSSSIAQIANVPQGIASARHYSIAGATRSFAQIFEKNIPMSKSSFIQERYSGGIFNKFDTGIFDRTKQGAIKMLGVLDEIGTKFIWNSHYAKAVAEKMADPIKYADDITRKLVAGRGIGESPLIQKSKVFQMIAPFQLEVGNSWFAMRDMWGKDKKQALASFAIFFATTYLLNRVAEKVRGNDVTFDPIQALIEGSQQLAESDNKARGVAQLGGRLAGEVLSNLPLGQTLASMYPEKGIGKNGLERAEFFGKGDPTRYGSGLLAMKALSDPLFKLLPPFGGGQLQKTYQGLRSYFSGEVKNNAGDTNYKVEKNAGTAVQMGLFGKYGTSDARNFFKTQDKLFDIITEQKTASGSLQIQAEEEWERLKEIGVENQDEAAAQFDNLFKENPELAQKVADVYEEEKLGLDKTDRLIKMLGVKNGERARYIFAEVSEMDDAEKEEYYGSLIEKGVVTQEVSEQIATMVAENKPTFEDGQEVSKTGIIHSVVNFAKALGVDPQTAFKAMFTKEQLEYVKGNVAVLKRIEFKGKTGSEAIAQRRSKEQGVDRTLMKLDHVIPRQLGGDNGEENLNLITTEEWERNTPVENYLGRAVRNKTMKLSRARQLIQAFKSGELTAEQVMAEK